MLEKGCVVKSVAGHDKDKFYVVVDVSGGEVFIADGRERKLACPKRKNLKHIRATKTIVDESRFSTDKKLRELLKPFNDALKADSREGGN